MNLIWLESLASNQITLSHNLFEKLTKPKQIYFNFGSLKRKMNVIVERDLSDKTICLPKKLSDRYTIPTDIPYEYYFKKDELYIGPIIAYLSLGTLKDLKDKVYFSILPKFLEYQLINGLIYICTADTIDLKSDSVEGYYFDPNEQNPKRIWKHGKFPLPQSFYNRSFISQRKISTIQNKIGDTLFNSYWYNLNKWTLWKNLSGDERLRQHLPYTENYHGTKQLERLLDRFNSLYLKPFSSSRGRGILRLTNTSNGIFLTNSKMKTWHFKDFKSLSQSLDKRIKTPYIVQQEIFAQTNNRKLDFRIVVQKDGSRKWSYSGLMARTAPVGGIITNMRGMADTILGKDALVNFFKLDIDSAEKVESEMTNLVIKAVEKYEKKGMHLGDVAADIIIDHNYHIWILELQLNQAIYGRTDLLPIEFFNKVMTKPFQYAKALAGFR